MIKVPLLEQAIDRSWVNDEPPRGYLGASILGKPCARELWYGFRWVSRKQFESRILRLFHRGNREEAVFELILQKAGVMYWPHDPATGEQYKVTFTNKHVGGHTDGMGTGLPDLPDGVMFITEFKTHSHKSFSDLVNRGVQKSKPVHFAQMQLYMHRLGIEWALYGAVNKNDDTLHWELVEYFPAYAKYYEDRADTIVYATTPLARISDNPGWHECKLCDFHHICHKRKPWAVNCRTCTMSQPLVDGTWWCGQHDTILGVEHQAAGCGDHVRILGD